MKRREEGLTGQPTAIAGETLRVIMDMGKFQGVMAATTPTGCFITTGRLVADTVCRTSPLTLLHSSANHSMEATLQAPHQGVLCLSCACSILGFHHLARLQGCTGLRANSSNYSTSCVALVWMAPLDQPAVLIVNHMGALLDLLACHMKHAYKQSGRASRSGSGPRGDQCQVMAASRAAAPQ